jgi:membrane protein
MATPPNPKRRLKRNPLLGLTSPAGSGKVPRELFVVAAVIGITRAIFGSSKKQGVAEPMPDPLKSDHDVARGRPADRPAEIPAKGWMDIAWRVYGGVQNDRVLLVAAGVTFYGLLAVFPATAAVVSLYGLFSDASSINEHLRLVSGFLPQGAIEVIGDQVKRIASHGSGTLSFAFLGTLALSLWGANSGTKAVFDALNIIYKEREKRSFVVLTLRSLLFTLGGIVLAVTALAAVIIAPVALNLLGIPDTSWTALLSLLRWPLLYLVILLALACLYRYGPSRTYPKWRWVTWGSAIAGAIWLIGSLLLSWYVANFGTYNATYGSLGAVIGFMVWLWLSTTIVLLGAEINAEMEHQTAKDTTQGQRKPLGRRGARVADEIGEARA